MKKIVNDDLFESRMNGIITAVGGTPTAVTQSGNAIVTADSFSKKTYELMNALSAQTSSLLEPVADYDVQLGESKLTGFTKANASGAGSTSYPLPIIGTYGSYIKGFYDDGSLSVGDSNPYIHINSINGSYYYVVDFDYQRVTFFVPTQLEAYSLITTGTLTRQIQHPDRTNVGEIMRLTTDFCYVDCPIFFYNGHTTFRGMFVAKSGESQFVNAGMYMLSGEVSYDDTDDVLTVTVTLDTISTT